MSIAAIYALLPLVVLSGGILVIMLQVAFWRNMHGTVALTVITLAGAALASTVAVSFAPLQVTPPAAGGPACFVLLRSFLHRRCNHRLVVNSFPAATGR